MKNRIKTQVIVISLFFLVLLSPWLTVLARLSKVAVGILGNDYSVSAVEILKQAKGGKSNLKCFIKKNPKLLYDIVNALNGYGGWKFLFIDYFGAVQKCLKKNYATDADKGKNLYRVNKHYLASVVPKRDMTDISERLLHLNTLLKEKRIDLIYVQVPDKVCKYNPGLPRGVKEYGNENADKFLKLIQQGGVSTIDLRDELHRSGMDHSSMFFHTDHHWKPESGLWASLTILDKLLKKYHFDVDPQIRDINNYQKTYLSSCFLGSWGKRIGRYYEKPDDFTVISPKFDTKFQSIIEDQKEETGTFDEVLTDKQNLQCSNSHNSCHYLYYTGRDYALQKIKNLKSRNHFKIFWIKDSFSCVTMPFMALFCEDLVVVDLIFI